MFISTRLFFRRLVKRGSKKQLIRIRTHIQILAMRYGRVCIHRPKNITARFV
jgi:hypothetical protein